MSSAAGNSYSVPDEQPEEEEEEEKKKKKKKERYINCKVHSIHWNTHQNFMEMNKKNFCMINSIITKLLNCT